MKYKACLRNNWGDVFDETASNNLLAVKKWARGAEDWSIYTGNLH